MRLRIELIALGIIIIISVSMLIVSAVDTSEGGEAARIIQDRVGYNPTSEELSEDIESQILAALARRRKAWEDSIKESADFGDGGLVQCKPSL